MVKFDVPYETFYLLYLTRFSPFVHLMRCIRCNDYASQCSVTHSLVEAPHVFQFIKELEDSISRCVCLSVPLCLTCGTLVASTSSHSATFGSERGKGTFTCDQQTTTHLQPIDGNCSNNINLFKCTRWVQDRAALSLRLSQNKGTCRVHRISLHLSSLVSDRESYGRGKHMPFLSVSLNSPSAFIK